MVVSEGLVFGHVTWTTSPHPILNDHFSAWSEEVERGRAQDLEHERVENAMLNI